MKQTAVEWLVEKVNSDCLNSTFIKPSLIEQAKQMEKDQIEDSFYNGIELTKIQLENIFDIADFDSYFEETFNS
jgi:hypothetical protein